jgi:hypothetical protein
LAGVKVKGGRGELKMKKIQLLDVFEKYLVDRGYSQKTHFKI